MSILEYLLYLRLCIDPPEPDEQYMVPALKENSVQWWRKAYIQVDIMK